MAFFEDLGSGRFRATEHTVGPWDERFQHGGPPSALMARALEQVDPRPEMMVARMTVEILGPIPVAELIVTANVVRPGRSVELLQATLSHEGRDVARAAAWRIGRTRGVAIPSRAEPPPALPEEQEATSGRGWDSGYLRAMEWRWAVGHIRQAGPATGWGRMRMPLLEGEEPSSLSRVMILADSGNGASSELRIEEWNFINPELSVHLHREAVGEWICLDSVTTVSEGGVGLATSRLSDLDGPIGVGAQSLLVSPRR